MKPLALRLGFISLLFVLANRPLGAQADDHLFRLEGVRLLDGERVVSIDVSVVAGDFAAVSGLPPGWQVNIDNDASWHTSLKGDAQLGAAALDAGSVQKMRMLVHKFEFGDLKFHLAGTLVVTKNFVDLRKVPLEARNFKQEPSSQVGR